MGLIDAILTEFIIFAVSLSYHLPCFTVISSSLYQYVTDCVYHLHFITIVLTAYIILTTSSSLCISCAGWVAAAASSPNQPPQLMVARWRSEAASDPKAALQWTRLGPMGNESTPEAVQKALDNLQWQTNQVRWFLITFAVEPVSIMPLLMHEDSCELREIMFLAAPATDDLHQAAGNFGSPGTSKQQQQVMCADMHDHCRPTYS